MADVEVHLELLILLESRRQPIDCVRVRFLQAAEELLSLGKKCQGTTSVVP
jgi:hypothetical protein